MSMNPGDRDGEPAPADVAVETCGPLDLELRFVATLLKLIAYRSSTETEIEARYQLAKKAAEQEFHDAFRAFEKWLETEQHAIVEDYSEQCRQASTKFKVQTSNLDRELTKLREQVEDQFQTARRDAKQELDEACWQAEASFDAAKKAAPKQLDEFERQLEAWQTRIRADREQAQKLLERWRQEPPEVAETPPAAVRPAEFSARLQECVDIVSTQLAELSQAQVPRLAISPTMWAGYLLVAFLLAIGGWQLGFGVVGAGAGVAIALVGGVGMTFILKSMARSLVEDLYPPLWQASAEAEGLMHRALTDARNRTGAQQSKLTQQRDRALQAAEKQYQARLAEIDAQREARLKRPTDTYTQLVAEITARRDEELATAEATRTHRDAEYHRRKGSEGGEIEARYKSQCEQIEEKFNVKWQELLGWWKAGLARVQSLLDQIHGATGGVDAQYLADWIQLGGHWQPTTRVPPAIRFGQFLVDLSQLPDGIPQHSLLSSVTPRGYLLPALLPFPDQASIIFKARGDGRQLAVTAIQSIMLRLLTNIPPGKIRFTIIDPVGLGENFAAFMHLADYNEALVSSRIWTEPRHIEQRLTDLSEHMENVIQKYLRNEYQNIEEYNREAGEIAEPYRFLVVANFPAGFTEAAQRRLLSIAASGSRCGVYTLIMVDMQLPLPAMFSLRDLDQHAASLLWHDGRFLWQQEEFSSFELTLDSPPPAGEVTESVHTAGQLAGKAGRVEVSFDVIAPPAEEYWTSSARSGIDVPLGRAGATRLQNMRLGSGTSQHVLVAGKTGSGKSTLLHALITNIALRYSPDEVELYLIDFKQGVEFKTYATHKLPHARVIAIESDREFGVSVLARLDAELKRRADLFRAVGVQDLAGFRQAEPATAMPRTMLIIDEFQEFFTEDDRASQEAALLLDRLVRQGRAFGVHVLLGSQTLAGAYSLARSTIGQMAVRIALQCSETDANLILSEENSAARLLSRPGEAIYNDTNGMIEGNHPFQIVWLPEERRENYLEKVRELCVQRGQVVRPQVVFEGNVPANPEQNLAFHELLAGSRPATMTKVSRAWLGEPVAIKDVTTVTFRLQSGSNLLMVGQNEEAALGVFLTAMISLAAQQPVSETAGPRFFVVDGSPAGTPPSVLLASLPDLTPDPVRLGARRELPAMINELAEEVSRRQKSGEADFPPIYIMAYGLHKLRDLWKAEDDYGFGRMGEDRPPSPNKQFATILSDGPALGVYSLVWVDSVNNLNRAWDRHTLREFEMRIAFQMSGNDSSALLDSPVAAKLGNNRALLHSEEQGSLEKFRPFRWPSDGWLAWVRKQLHGPEGQRDDRSKRLAV
jgi:energy-coupling factor transporter ATP-binding protein EcfA2